MKSIKSENDVKKKIIKPWLDSLGAWHFMPVSNGMGKHGVPDHIACVPVTITKEMVGMKIGLFVAPEAKAPDKKHNASSNQISQMRQIDQAGGITGVISSEWDKDHMNWHLDSLLRGLQG